MSVIAKAQYIVTENDQKDLLNNANPLAHIQAQLQLQPRKKRKVVDQLKRYRFTNFIVIGCLVFLLIVCFTGITIHYLKNENVNQNKKEMNIVKKYSTDQDKGNVSNEKSLSINFTNIQSLKTSQKVNSTPKYTDYHINFPQSIKSKSAQKTTHSSNIQEIAGISSVQKERAKRWVNMVREDIFAQSQLATQQRDYYQKKYNISQFEQLPFCIVIPSHNNVKDNRHINNIKSVLMQEYTNYHIVFIDDASTDGTGEQIQKYLTTEQKKIPPQNYVIIRNKEQKMAMPNLRMAAQQYCKPQDIYLIADGDDQLLGRQVLKLFNTIFQKQQVWFLYSNFLTSTGGIGYSRPFLKSTIDDNKYRSYPFVTSHLRAFYTQLFLNIKEEDLKDEKGLYLKAANDVAICIPILEMSHKRVRYLPELNYRYNANTGLNNHKIRLNQQKSNNMKIRQRGKYKALTDLFLNNHKQNNNITKQIKTNQNNPQNISKITFT